MIVINSVCVTTRCGVSPDPGRIQCKAKSQIGEEKDDHGFCFGGKKIPGRGASGNHYFAAAARWNLRWQPSVDYLTRQMLLNPCP
jgi:hypothetical protein